MCPLSHRFLSFLFHFDWPSYSWDKGILTFNVESRSSMSCVRSKFTVRVCPTSYRLACQSSMPIGPVITGLWLFFFWKNYIGNILSRALLEVTWRIQHLIDDSDPLFFNMNLRLCEKRVIKYYIEIKYYSRRKSKVNENQVLSYYEALSYM